MVVEYSEAVLECKRLKEKDIRLKPNPTYIQDVQAPDVNDRMRAILVDWIVEVHHKFDLDPETLLLAVNLFDRFLSKRKVDRKRLQLVGVTCLLIASKYEDSYPPEVRDCVYMTDNAYQAEEVLDTEVTILNTLGFTITIPSSLFFLEQMLKEECASEALRAMSHLMLELNLPDYRMVGHSPPLLAAGSIYLAKVIVLGVRDPWTPALERLSGHTGADARAVAKLVGAILQRTMHPQASLVAIRKKFNSAKWSHSTPAACKWLASRGVPRTEIFDDTAQGAPERGSTRHAN